MTDVPVPPAEARAALQAAEQLCGETVTVWKGSGAGEVCVCGKDYRHVFSKTPAEQLHLCDCRFQSSWSDDQQWAEAKARREESDDDR
ncbi:MAG TPA: hypothetical protein VGH54_05565 [Mycobacterium sp.]|jgi:hypothetical protein|uniref:hypothetical protein n=1 Tax=Mycobacterium sp. TaxID=1785 RepID=UPI002F3F8632